MHSSKCRMHNLLRTFCILHCALCIFGCSIPNLEDPVCTEARTDVREFYSFHFGNEMSLSPDNLKKREPFLTPRFFQEVSNEREGVDPFTSGTTEQPKAFRVGECRAASSTKAEFQILLFWRDDIRNEQREVEAVVVRNGDKWLIDDVQR
jgi:hypothetical protein